MGPTLDRDERRPTVTVSRAIEVSVSELWDVISTPGNLEPAHPFCARNPVTRWPGIGSRDEVHYLSGWVYEREFIGWDDGVGYDLLIGGAGEPRSHVSWRVAPTGAGDSTLEITIQPRTLRSIVPSWLERPAHAVYVRPLLRRYLASVTCGFEWYLTTGRAVPRNQFGRHPWFSER